MSMPPTVTDTGFEVATTVPRTSASATITYLPGVVGVNVSVYGAAASPALMVAPFFLNRTRSTFPPVTAADGVMAALTGAEPPSIGDMMVTVVCAWTAPETSRNANANALVNDGIIRKLVATWPDSALMTVVR